MVPFDKEGSVKNWCYRKRKQASVDLSKDVDGPKSPDDTFQVSASLGIFHTDYSR